MSSASVATDSPALPPFAAAGRQAPRDPSCPPPGYRDEFDRDYPDALAEAGRSLDLDGIHDTLEHWRVRSWVKRDKQEHRRVVRRAFELLTGHEPAADEPVAVTEARL